LYEFYDVKAQMIQNDPNDIPIYLNLY